MLRSLEVPASNDKIISYAVPLAPRQPCVRFYPELRQSRNTHTQASQDRNHSSLRGNRDGSRAAGVQLFLSHPTTKAQFLSLFFFFLELFMLHLDFLFVCFEKEQGNSLVRASNNAILCPKWEGTGEWVGEGTVQGGGEG